jgi:hypothetical protein
VVSTVFGVPAHYFQDRKLKEAELPWVPGWSPRTLLQFVGTEMFRNQFGPDVWIKTLVRSIQEMPKVRRWVVTDARFPDELKLGDCLEGYRLKGYRVVTVCIRRRGLKRPGISGHSSERTLKCEYTVDNNGTIKELYQRLEVLLDKIESKGK